MYNENKGNIGRYYAYSILFHLALIGLIVYLSIRYKPEIQSIGSKVAVSIVSKVPGPPASVKAIMRPAEPKTKPASPKQTAARPAPAKKPAYISVSRRPASMSYPKKVALRPVPYRRPAERTPAPPNSINSSVYANLNSTVSLNNAYNKVAQSLIKGNIHRFQNYINKIVSVVMSHFNISLSKYLHYKSVVAIQITDSGRIYGVRLVKSSGNAYFDSQAIEAAKLSSPLPPPPKNFMDFMNAKNSGEGALIVFDPKMILDGL